MSAASVPGRVPPGVPENLRGALQICGCTSDAGKSTLVAGLCRLLARNGISVAPFKAQNMALNSFVTRNGDEIGRAQGAQSLAAGIEPEVIMNPILLKPTGDRSSQVVVMGHPVGVMTAAEYHEHKPQLLETVLESLAELRRRFDVVLCEGAGSPTEINLLDHDIVNLRIAKEAGMAAIVVGDIDRGGVFAHLYGTVALLPDDLRPLVQGFVINRFRGDPALLGDGMETLRRRSGVPTLGILPMLRDLWLDGEDSLALDVPYPSAGPALADSLDVVVVRLPQISNYTDVDALALEPGLSVRYVSSAEAIGRPDLVVLPGSKETVRDLTWMRSRGIDGAIRASGADVLGICAGYQMLGDIIEDDVESGEGTVPALGWLPGVATTFGHDKVLARFTDDSLSGYQIHHGRVTGGPGWVPVGGGVEGAVSLDGRVRGTTFHGLFEHDGFRTGFLTDLAGRRGKRFVPAGVDFAASRQGRFDRIADAIEEHLDLDALFALVQRAIV
ncbi:MAG: cobyric acid synthase CobQ [Ilumatobacteraceae bacterium]|nr:cobyric acid synthase CobQ [Ilumatobacteraceae bacterium]